MNKQKSKARHPLRTKRHKIIWLAIALISLIALVTILWLLPPQPDPERFKFKTLRDDMRLVAEDTKDVVVWSKPHTQCIRSGDVGLQEGGWYCEVSIQGSLQDNNIDTIEDRLVATGKVYRQGVKPKHTLVSVDNEVICRLRLLSDKATVYFACGDASSKSWYPPDSGSTGGSLPGAGAWKRLDS